MDKKNVQSRFENMEQSDETERKKVTKELNSLREVLDRIRRKVDETNHSMIEIRSETDDKLSAKEG